METRKLKRMLELKRRIEQAKKGDVVSARQETDAAELSLLTAQAEQRERVAALAETSELSLAELVERARFVELSRERIVSAHHELDQRKRELDEREEARVLATRDVRTFEILSERDREEQRARAKSAEQRAADDVASARRGRA